MKTNFLILISFFCCISISSQEQKRIALESIKFVRDHVILENKTIQDSLGDSYDQLLQDLNTIIYVTKSINKDDQLKSISSYFTSVEKILDYKLQPNNLAYNNLTEDIRFKIRKSENYNAGNLEPYNFLFGSKLQLIITALINTNHLEDNRFRLYYSNLLYPDITSNIKANDRGLGSSDELKSPYNLNVPFSKKIIFWLVDTNTKEIYLPDCNEKIIQENPSKFTITFNKSNLK